MIMMRAILFTSVFLVLTVSHASEPDPTPAPAPTPAASPLQLSYKFIGLAEVPKFFGNLDPEIKMAPKPTPTPKAGANKPTTKSIVKPVVETAVEEATPVPLVMKLMKEPNSKSEVAFEISDKADFETREYNYEELAVIASEKSGDWVRVVTKKGLGWLAPGDAGTFHSYEDLIRVDASYATSVWDGRLYKSPDTSSRSEKIPLAKSEPGDYWMSSAADIKVRETNVVNGVLWIKVFIVTGRCETEEKFGKSGWIPAYTEKQEINFWFRSRGC